MLRESNHREEEIRIEKMIAEGGPVMSSYFNDSVSDKQIEEKLAAKAMVDEGGLGAEYYYNDDEKIAKIDVEQKNNDYVS